MIAQTSPLKLLNFTLFELEYSSILPDEGDAQPNWEEIIPEYPVEIEFSHKSMEEDIFRVGIRIEVNNGEAPQAGYRLAAEGAGIFRLAADQPLDEKLANNLRVFSSLNICINSIRNEFSSVTSQSPIGRYYLPAIDIASLIQQKREEVEKEKKQGKKKLTKSIK
jgi:preprotein translocase subunit SecB